MKQLPVPDFADDDGSPDPDVRQALATWSADRRDGPVLAALCRSRLLVPVVAMATQTDVDERGLTRDRTADVAAVLMQGHDGRMALLAFTGLDALQAWRADARPVPIRLDDAARSARHEGADALVLDVAGPSPYVVEGAAVQDLAAGRAVVATDQGHVWVEVAAATADRERFES